MGERVFLAGAAGAIGRVLGPLLVRAGYEVHGSTRQAGRAQALEAQGVAPVIVDVFDAQALSAALGRVAPGIVIHQLTDLPPNLDPALMAAALERNSRIREIGTRNLVAAARAAGAGHLLAQSIAWVYAPGREPHEEGDVLDLQCEGARLTSVRGVVALEEAVLGAGLQGAVLRYGYFYGPGTGFESRDGPACGAVHVEAAAVATLLAVQRGASGIFNIAEDHPAVSNAKARRELGWAPQMRAA